MPRIHPYIPVILAATVHAGELTLESKPFFIAHSIDATALPAVSEPVRVDAEAWAAFEINSIAGHGAAVKKGDPLVLFETEAIDRKIADTEQAVATASLGLARAEQDLKTLENTLAERLARLERAAAVAAEELDHFTKVGRKSAEETADQSHKRSEQVLASYQEELKQLLKMYEADDATEETEEIILKQQRDAVAAAEFSLRMETLDRKRTVEVKLPRQLVSLTEARDDTALALANGKIELPRTLESAKLEVAALKTALEREKDALADLQQDRKLFAIKAPADGFFHHGEIKDGKWVSGDLVKGLVPGGLAPVGKTFATFIPATAKPLLHAFPDQATARALSAGTEGVAVLPGREDVTIAAKLLTIAANPAPDLTHPATFSAEWSDKITIPAGQAVKIHFVSHKNESAITVPTKALTYGPKGWTVEVKLADGKTESRAVKRGLSNGEQTEIISGLEAGQVVIVP